MREGKPQQKDANDILAKLADVKVSKQFLVETNAGLELDQRFWRKHPEVGERVRDLVVNWKAACGFGPPLAPKIYSEKSEPVLKKAAPNKTKNKKKNKKDTTCSEGSTC